MSVQLAHFREALKYDRKTGMFTWKVLANTNGALAGQVAGYKRDDGYIEIGFAGRAYRAHRLAWAFVHGAWPEGLLDHKNGVRDDNRLVNLRLTTRSLNLQNQRKPRSNNRTGLLGVSPVKRRQGNAWRATIKVDGKHLHLGSFDCPQKAHRAYLKAKRSFHEACTI